MKPSKALVWVFVMLLATGFLFWAVPNGYITQNQGLLTDKTFTLNNNWVYHGELNTEQTYTLPLDLPVEAYHAVSISRKLGAFNITDPYICIQTNNAILSASVGPNTIYNMGGSFSYFVNRMTGKVWNVFPLPKEYVGKTLMISTSSPYEKAAGHFDTVYIGTKTALLFNILRMNMWVFLGALLVFFFGIFLILINFGLHTTWIKKNRFLYLGFFCIFTSCWMLNEAGLMQFFTGNQFLIGTMTYFCYNIMPLPLFLYIAASYDQHHFNFYPILYTLFVANFFVSFMLQLINAMDLMQSVLITQLLMLAGGVALVFFLHQEWKKHKNKEARNFLLTFSILILAGFSDAVIYNFIPSVPFGAATLLGILLYLIVMIVVATRKICTLQTREQEAQSLKQLAYRDLLTQGNNRTAYYRDVKEVFNHNNTEDSWLLLLDMNGLKSINDHYGHTMGDLAIKAAYNCIDYVFGEIGTCYRIGGDEFACIIRNADKETIDQALERLTMEASKINETTKYEFGIAVGYAQYIPGAFKNFDVFSTHVDRLMYSSKKQMKAALRNKSIS